MKNQSSTIINKTLVFCLFGIFSFTNISCSQSQEKNNDLLTKTDKIDELISLYSEYGNFNGSVVVVEDGKVIHEKGYGFANMEWEVPNEPNTKFRIASITKQFTAMLVLQLVAENKLDLHQPISAYLPDYPIDKAEIITLHHLLTHSSGIPDYGAFENYTEFERERYQPEDIIALFVDLPLEFQPGSRYSYSNSGYVLIGHILEKTTGVRYENLLKEKILDPLEMNDSGYDRHWTVLKNRASGYYQMWGNWYNANFLDMSLPYAAGSMYSTGEDLAKWDQALYTEKLLPKEYLDQIFEKHVPASDRFYGYGWKIGDMPVGNDKKWVGTTSHGGGMDGVRTLITRFPENNSSIILLGNTQTPYLYEMTISIGGILFDEPYDLPKKSIAKSMLEIIDEKGMDEAMVYYNEVKNSIGCYLNEEELIMVGYDLLRSDRLEEALAIFEIAKEAYPRSFNTYDSYAEAQMLLGNTEEAIKNYEKSIELNPDNENGKMMLRKLKVNE